MQEVTLQDIGQISSNTVFIYFAVFLLEYRQFVAFIVRLDQFLCWCFLIQEARMKPKRFTEEQNIRILYEARRVLRW